MLRLQLDSRLERYLQRHARTYLAHKKLQDMLWDGNDAAIVETDVNIIVVVYGQGRRAEDA